MMILAYVIGWIVISIVTTVGLYVCGKFCVKCYIDYRKAHPSTKTLDANGSQATRSHEAYDNYDNDNEDPLDAHKE